MSESLVDLSYRGLALGKRIKLTQVRASTGYLEVPAPMPVGTTISIASEEGITIDATVAEVREHTTGTDRTPGMLVRPKLDGDEARAWWKERVSVVEETAAPEPDADGKVTVRARRTSGEQPATDLADDGRNTAVIPAVDDAPVEDDGKRTTMMDAADLAALGLDPAASSGSIPAITDDDSGPSGDGKKKKKRR